MCSTFCQCICWWTHGLILYLAPMWSAPVNMHMHMSVSSSSQLLYIMYRLVVKQWSKKIHRTSSRGLVNVLIFKCWFRNIQTGSFWSRYSLKCDWYLSALLLRHKQCKGLGLDKLESLPNANRIDRSLSYVSRAHKASSHTSAPDRWMVFLVSEAQ